MQNLFIEKQSNYTPPRIKNINRRNYGIDLLKIIAMWMVVVLHVLRQGGVLSSCVEGSFPWYVSWFLEIGAYGAVNCFALTTGYLMVNKGYKTSRIITLWLEVVFYALLTTLIMQIILPTEVSLELWLRSLFPVMFKAYWYFSSYFALFFFIPFINRLYRNISERESGILITICLILFSLMSFLIADPFTVGGGYTTLWLVALYFVGAHAKKFGLFCSLKKRWFAVGYLLGVGLTLVSIPVLKYFTSKILGAEVGVMSFISYISPTVVFSSISLFIFCSRLEIKNNYCRKILATLSPLAFGVYIVHLHPLIFNTLLTNHFAFLGDLNVLVMAVGSIGASIGIYAACTVIVYLRSLLFKLCRVNQFSNFVGDKIDSFLRAKVYGKSGDLQMGKIKEDNIEKSSSITDK